MLKLALERLNAAFPLAERDPGAFARVQAGPMRTRVRWFYAAGLGNVSAVSGRALLGLMRMDTLVINAVEKDAPLFSFDWIAAMGRDTLLVEYYNTLQTADAFDAAPLEAVRAAASALPDHDLGAHWYDPLKLPASFAKRAGGRAKPDMERAFLSGLDAYIAACKACPAPDDPQGKRAKAAAYVNGLLENGGPSTDAFKKAIGEAQTRALFTRVIFGTET